MIELRVALTPTAIPTAERVLWELEAYYRTEPAVGAPGTWLLGDTVPVATSGDTTVSVPAGVGRYHVAVRLKRISDDYVLPAFADDTTCHEWPSAARTIITCGADEEDNAPITITVGDWRRTGVATSEIPITIENDGYDDTLTTEMQVRREGTNVFTSFETLAAADQATNYPVSGSEGGFAPTGLDDMGRTLFFRAHQLTADGAQRADSNTVEKFAGVPPITGLRASVESVFGLPFTQRVQVSWTPIGIPPRVAPAEGADYRVTVALVPAGETFDIARHPFTVVSDSDGVTSLTSTSGLTIGQTVRVIAFRSVYWYTDLTFTAYPAGWPPADNSLVAETTVVVANTTDAPPAPTAGTPFSAVGPLVDGVPTYILRAVSTIGSGSGAAMHFDALHRDVSTGLEVWTALEQQEIAHVGASFAQTVKVTDSSGRALRKFRWRQSRLTIMGIRRYGAYLEWTA